MVQHIATVLGSTPAPPSRGATSRCTSAHGSISATSWKTSNIRHITQQVALPVLKQASSLVHAYMVCGLSRDPTEWLPARPTNGKLQRTSGAVGSFLSPQILGSIPAHDQDEETVQLFAAAVKNAFPNDCEICVGPRSPGSTCHSFVLQMSLTRSIYGVALRLWVRSDSKRTHKIAQKLETAELDQLDSKTGVWIPYCLAFLSHYPLFDLMADYLRCSWMLWSKDPDNFNTNGVLRLMRMPAPQPNQLLRVSLDKYTLCYQIPSVSRDFQNFSLWPLFTCLSPKHIVAIMEASLSARGQIIYTSQHTAILTTVMEAVRFYLGLWAGLYVPVVYGRRAQELVDEPGPYMLGVTKQSRALFNPPKDALVIDLDVNRIYTTSPPVSLSHRQRTKYSTLLSQALNTCNPAGVPNHLRSAYEQNVRFNAFGSALAEGSALSIEDPPWWDHQRVFSAMQYICARTRRNYKLLGLWKSVTPSTRVRTQDFNDVIHHRNHLARSLDDAWRECIDTKSRSDLREAAYKQREASLTTDLENSQQEFNELGECTEQLIEETRQLQAVVKQQNCDIATISEQLNNKALHAKQMSNHVNELQKEIDQTNQTLRAQQEVLDEMKRSRSPDVLSQERDAAQRAVIHLTSLISGQVAHIERVMASLIAQGRPNPPQDLRKDAAIRQSFQRSPSPQVSPPLLKRRTTSDFSPVNEKSNRRLSQLVHEKDSFDDKVRMVAETVRKINSQCFAAIEDLAARSDSRASLVTNTDRDTLPPTPDLDSRADTRQSDSVWSMTDADGKEDDNMTVKIQQAIDEVESELVGEQFTDACRNNTVGSLEGTDASAGVVSNVKVA